MTKKNSKTKYLTELRIGIRQHFKNSFLANRDDDRESFEQYLQKNLYFVTVSFRNSFKNNRFVLDRYGKLHFELMRSLYGSKLSKKKNQQPITYAFVDFDSTRTGRVVDPYFAVYPHIHALMLVKPKQHELFDGVEFQLNRLSKEFGLGAICDVRKFQDEESLPILISYASKGLESVRASQQADFWGLIPRR